MSSSESSPESQRRSESDRESGGWAKERMEERGKAENVLVEEFPSASVHFKQFVWEKYKNIYKS